MAEIQVEGGGAIQTIPPTLEEQYEYLISVSNSKEIEVFGETFKQTLKSIIDRQALLIRGGGAAIDNHIYSDDSDDDPDEGIESDILCGERIADNYYKDCCDKLTKLIADLDQHAKHSAKRNAEDRLLTFKDEEAKFDKQSCGGAQYCKLLVDAGFWYLGPADNVRCFYCDGGLKNFTPNDIPLVEHKKWFGECKYVKFLETQAEIKRIEERHRNTTTPTQKTTRPAPRQTPVYTPERAVYNLTPRELKARMETPQIQKMIEKGYNKDHIKQALERRFAIVGDDYESLEQLVTDIAEMQGPEALPLCKVACAIYPKSKNRTKHKPVSGSTTTVGTAGGSTTTVGTAGTTKTVSKVEVNSVTKAVTGSVAVHIEASSASSANADIPNYTNEEVAAALKDQYIQDDELRSLWNEYEQNKQVLTCKVCFINPIKTVFLPCGHYVCCETCTPQLTNCCFCRAVIRGTVKALTCYDPAAITTNNTTQ